MVRIPVFGIYGEVGWRADNFSKVYSITFPLDDRCGLTEEHAMELKNIVDKILSETHSEKVNIVAHSKGGLDARWYIANSNPDKVANLIMIGTPNAGSPAASWTLLAVLLVLTAICFQGHRLPR